MMNAEDCRRKASECLRAAQLATDPDVRLAWHDLSDEWLTLAVQIVPHDSLQPKQSAPTTRRPVELAEPRRIAAEKMGDLLRERLTLTNFTLQAPAPYNRRTDSL